MLGIMVHPQNIDANFGASWQREPTQLCGFASFSDLQPHIILHLFCLSHMLTANSHTHIYGLLSGPSNAHCMRCHKHKTY